MILTTRYPHVRDLANHYCGVFSDTEVASILSNGLQSEEDAKKLSLFIWRMLDEMAKDKKAGNFVLGGDDNTAMAPDIAYEVDTLMADMGFSSIWEKISDEA